LRARLAWADPERVDPQDLFAEIRCETAEAFLDELSPARGRLWAEARRESRTGRDWIFRGVMDAGFPLRPSALRDGAFAAYAFDEGGSTVRTASEQRAAERHLMDRFCAEADSLGIHLPGDRPELRDRRCAQPEDDPHEFPPINRLHMFALAQHYGIPTRLLDWTRRPVIAAYFAVEALAAQRRAGLRGQGPCAVWVLDAAAIDRLSRDASSDPTIDPAVFLVTAPRATNPNLAAQGGLFTLVQPRTGDPHPVPDLDEALRRVAPKLSGPGPVLCRITLPPAEARVTLRMLADEGVHAATVRPGLDGVVETLRERSNHQWAHPGHRT